MALYHVLQVEIVANGFTGSLQHHNRSNSSLSHSAHLCCKVFVYWAAEYSIFLHQAMQNTLFYFPILLSWIHGPARGPVMHQSLDFKGSFSDVEEDTSTVHKLTVRNQRNLQSGFSSFTLFPIRRPGIFQFGYECIINKERSHMPTTACSLTSPNLNEVTMVQVYQLAQFLRTRIYQSFSNYRRGSRL